MKGLLLKDGYMVTKLCRSILLIDLVFIVAACFADQNAVFLTYPCIVSTTIPMTLLAFEEKEKWNQYAGTLPYTKAQLVSSKYLLALIGSAAVTVLVACAEMLHMHSKEAFALPSFLAMILLLWSVCLVFPSVLYPFLFKFGAEKGRLIFYVFYGAGWAAVLLLGKMDVRAARLNVPALLGGIAVAVSLLFALSWLLSIHFYQKREL